MILAILVHIVKRRIIACAMQVLEYIVAAPLQYKVEAMGMTQSKQCVHG